MAAWWDEVHPRLWKLAERSDLLAILDAARRVGRDVAAGFAAGHGLRPREWTREKAQALECLDGAGLTSLVASSGREMTTRVGLALLGLAETDGGLAAACLSGSLAQMILRDFGTQAQCDRYLDASRFRHGAFCLTEPIPGAGADALFLSGTFQVAGQTGGGEPVLEIHKRGRFTSHMEFADFVVAAVQAHGDCARGSCLVILEPGDPGEFDRGVQVRKLGHRFASTTNPAFTLRIPASRIVGGFTMEDGQLAPIADHRRAVEPALRRTRVHLGLMTASKALAAVETLMEGNRPADGDLDSWGRVSNLWAAGEAAASLGFAAARLSDSIDDGTGDAADSRQTASLFASAAKLFSSKAVAERLRAVAPLAATTSLHLQNRLIDAQVEAMYMGPEATQRRLVSAVAKSGEFLAELSALIRTAEAMANAGGSALAAGMRMWQWTMRRLLDARDARGAKLYSDARQGVTFAMADALCGLSAAHSMARDSVSLVESARPDANVLIFLDLSLLASASAALATAEACAGLLYGYADRFPVSAEAESAFEALRAGLQESLDGTGAARTRVACFLRSGNAERQIVF